MKNVLKRVLPLTLLLVGPVDAAQIDHPCMNGSEMITANALQQTRTGFQRKKGGRPFRWADIYAPQILPLPVSARLAVRKDADRYGAYAAHVFDKEGWVQGRLVEAGLALIMAGSAPPACLSALREAEGKAIKFRRGLWKQPAFRLKSWDVEAMAPYRGQLVVVTGKVRSVGDRTRRLYLNFGQNWAQDFTVLVVKTGRGAFKERDGGALARLLAAKGKTVRVRGVLEERQGPLIRLADEAQIDILD